MTEIERKFLLRAPIDEIIASARQSESLVALDEIDQHYLSDSGSWAIRCRRIADDTGSRYFLTLKRGISAMSAHEIETEIDRTTFEAMAVLCDSSIRKRRAKIVHKNVLWEIDQFLDPELDGLAFAEVELTSEDQKLILPDWIGLEITGDRAYTNVQIADELRRRRS